MRDDVIISLATGVGGLKTANTSQVMAAINCQKINFQYKLQSGAVTSHFLGLLMANAILINVNQGQ